MKKNFYLLARVFKEETIEEWLFDSGHSNHMMPLKDNFLDIDSSFSSKVKMGNGLTREVKGKGITEIQIKMGGKIIPHVLLLPEKDRNCWA